MAHEQQPMFVDTPRNTIAGSVRTFHLKLLARSATVGELPGPNLAGSIHPIGLFGRILAKADSITREGSPVDPSGTHAVLPLVRDVFHGGGDWVTLPAGKHTIEYQVNAVCLRNRTAYLPILFKLTMQTETGDTIEIDPALLGGKMATCKSVGDAYTRTQYGKVDVSSDGRYYVRASGQVHLSGNAHLRFV